MTTILIGSQNGQQMKKFFVYLTTINLSKIHLKKIILKLLKRHFLRYIENSVQEILQTLKVVKIF